MKQKLMSFTKQPLNEPDVLINKLNKTLSVLIKTINQENSFLEKGDFSNSESVINKKVASYEEFEKVQQEIAQWQHRNKNEKTNLIFAKVRPLFNELDKVTNQNEILIRANIEVANKMLEIYKDSKRESTIKQFGYDKKGNNAVSNKLEKIMPSTTLNNKI